MAGLFVPKAAHEPLPLCKPKIPVMNPSRPLLNPSHRLLNPSQGLLTPSRRQMNLLQRLSTKFDHLTPAPSLCVPSVTRLDMAIENAIWCKYTVESIFFPVCRVIYLFELELSLDHWKSIN